jgi:hypothetical protein
MVWQVQHLEFRRATLDFRSSGQGQRDVTQVLFDGELFANAADLTSWDADLFQVLVCDHCGIEDCGAGNWVEIRRLGDACLFTPCLSGDLDLYFPPRSFERRGIPMLSDRDYRWLRQRLHGLPQEPRLLMPTDIAHLIACEAPAGLLVREASRFRILAQLVVAVSEGEVEAAARQLEALLNECAGASEPATTREVGASDTRLSFYLNDKTFTEWTPLVQHSDGTIGLLLGNQSVRVEVAGGQL